MSHLIFITGGVISSLGKGLTGASLALLLKKRGLKVKQIKMDPYLNVDPGTMSPFQHGEVFVTEDGAETDLDLGHYERFTNQNVIRAQNITSGQIYESVINKERQGKYLGGTVQVIPHITGEIKERIYKIAQGTDITLVEVGGTVGDIESLPFLEAIRQVQFELGTEHVCFIHMTLVPFIETAGEIKTIPTQHSVQELRRIGIQPDILVCRSDRVLPDDIKNKIALFANMKVDNVMTARNVDPIHKIPLELHKEGLDKRVCHKFRIKTAQPDLKTWKKFVSQIVNPDKKVRIAVVGKYIENKDSYMSLNEALIHGAAENGAQLKVDYIDSEIFEKKRFDNIENINEILGDCDGVLVPGGFGDRGIEGKVKAIQWARVKKVPFLGICLGMQLASIEFARNVCGLKKAHSGEFFEDTKARSQFVIDFMTGQKTVNKGASMRLGAYSCQIKKNTLAYKAYKKVKISERHRHRLEFQNKFMKKLEKNGMIFGGINKEHDLVEVIELKEHPWFLACQYHPEFKSRPERPHPLFRDFIKASLG